jgi:SPP1 family predicted phage head-tail adaptor
VGLKAGRLRHRVDIEQPVSVQDPVSGGIVRSWAVVHEAVPAAIEPMSVREFLAAQQLQSGCSVMIIIRYLPGLHAAMRIRNGTTIYNPAGFLPDKDSNNEYLTAPCSEGTNEG